MTDRPDVLPVGKPIGMAQRSAQNSVRAVFAILLGGCVSATAIAEDALSLAAEDATSCRELRDPDIRLACLDAAADRLAEALASMADVGGDAGDMPIASVAPDAPETPEAPAAVQRVVKPSVAPSTETSVEAAAEVAEQQPEWAAAPEPEPRKVDEADTPRRFEATIVRITSNNVGRHRFYTEDGAVWEQTQLVDVVQPDSLPTVAEFRRRFTGNPTISFDVSNRSYRVRRIE